MTRVCRSLSNIDYHAERGRPNPQREFSRNNYGEVWAVATAENERTKTVKHWWEVYLVVTFQLNSLDQPEVSK